MDINHMKNIKHYCDADDQVYFWWWWWLWW